MRSADLFGIYVRGLCSLLGARGMSIYLPSSPGSPARATLSHHGEPPSLPELADLTRADQFLHDIADDIRSLREAQPSLHAVEVPSLEPDGRLIGILPPFPSRLPDRRQASRRPRTRRTHDLAHADLWLGLRLGGDALVRLPPRDPRPRALDPAWGFLLGFAGDIARHSRRVSLILNDPVTGLPGRAEFQEELERALESAVDEDLPLALLMINPEDFNAINERISREAADEVLREVGGRLLDSCRREDLVARYGSVVFASILVDTDRDEGMRRAEEILAVLHEGAFLDGAVPLRFSLGLAGFDPEEGVGRGLDLIRRADAALGAAKRAGGGRIEMWRPGTEEQAGPLDRLTGIFTGQVAKDYRNMAVLSDTISGLAASAEPQALAERVVKGLFAAMKPDRVGLFACRPGEGVQLVYGVSRRGPASAAVEVEETLAVDDEERRVLEGARKRGRALESREGGGGEETLSFAVPLSAGEEPLGVLFLAGRARSMSLDSSDIVFLEALATPVALAMDRAHLTARQRRQEEQERQRLLAEVEELRQALRRTQIVYRSTQMEAALDRVRRVAPTDATVLITGESGTGKELFARAIHELSPRRDQPFVVVDCGAIPTTLIESELFGHEKGAFTGAQRREPGRLLQADRGTVLLDEIGELPLEAQSRLLRFVQDRHVTPVGGRAGRTVDVRVVAATNRDLAAEVEAGRFRADLYHRLNVVRLDIPALRDRPDDVRHLADHFCKTYSLIYGGPAGSFSAEAKAAVLRHDWPGNVRELQNRVMRAVILGQGSTITPADLGFAEEAPAGAGREEPPAGSIAPEPAAGPAQSEADPWERLRGALRQQIEQALAGRRPVAPLGRWLMNDLVQEADAAAGSVASRAAAILGTPLTTFRRRLEGSVAQAGAGWSPRPSLWPGVRSCLAALVRGHESGGGNLLKRIPELLIEEVLAQAPEPRVGAALVGVTLRTFQRRCESAKRIQRRSA
jgi:diguanylate cyclase (GGDEF)-like protein